MLCCLRSQSIIVWQNQDSNQHLTPKLRHLPLHHAASQKDGGGGGQSRGMGTYYFLLSKNYLSVSQLLPAIKTLRRPLKG